jgi:hypothetical protein
LMHVVKKVWLVNWNKNLRLDLSCCIIQYTISVLSHSWN